MLAQPVTRVRWHVPHGLQGARVVPLVGEREAAGVPEHVRVL
jgi:hypothetical protein